jgi:conjugal transfer pilus assembly protein TraW
MKRLWLITMMMSIATIAEAKDLGIVGNSFKVTEEGFLAMIERKLKGLDTKSLETKMQELAKRKVEEPVAVGGITRATEQREFAYDPSYILNEDVYLPDGKLLYAKGTTINPLDHISWQGKLVFIDSRDKEQVDWVKQIQDLQLNENEIPTEAERQAKMVLVAGKPIELERELGVAVYFDQAGELTSKFGIRHVPAIVEQEGKMLKVIEHKI